MTFRAMSCQHSPVMWMEVRRVLASESHECLRGRLGVGEAPLQLRRQGPQLRGGVASLTWPVGPLGVEPAGEGFGAA